MRRQALNSQVRWNMSCVTKIDQLIGDAAPAAPLEMGPELTVDAEVADGEE